MALTSREENLINEITYVAERLSRSLEDGYRLADIVEDLMVSPPAEADVIERYGFTLAELIACVNAFEAMLDTRDNNLPTQADWGAALNKVRTF